MILAVGSNIRLKVEQDMMVVFISFFWGVMSQVVSTISYPIGIMSLYIVCFSIILLSIVNVRYAFLSYISLSLSSLSLVSITGLEVDLANFSTTRLFGFSLSSLVLLFLFIADIVINYRVLKIKPMWLATSLLVIAHSLTNILFFEEDFSAFVNVVQLAIYFFIVAFISINNLRSLSINVLHWILVLSFIHTIVFFLTSVRFNYGGQSAVPVDILFSFWFIIPFAFINEKKGKLKSIVTYIFISAFYFSGNVVVGGKGIIIYLFISVVLFRVIISRNKNINIGQLLVSISIVAVSLIVFLDLLIVIFRLFEIDSLNYKLSQIKMLIDGQYFGGFYATSAGNILAEFITVWESNAQKGIGSVLFGGGLGAVSKDYFGYFLLSNDAYPQKMFETGNYYSFHLPLVNILNWFGVVGVFVFIIMVTRLVKGCGNISIALFLIVLCYFLLGYLKEHFIILVLCISLCNITDYKVSGEK